MIWGCISYIIMYNSVFLFIMLLAFNHTHLIPDSGVFLHILLYLLSFCPRIFFLAKHTCPTSLNIILYPSHLQPPPPVCPSAKTAAPFPLRCRPSLTHRSSFPTKLSQIHVSQLLFLAKPLNHPVDCHLLRIPVSLDPVSKH